MRKNAMLVMLSALMVSGFTAIGSQPASAHCGSMQHRYYRSYRHAPRYTRTFRRTYVSERIITRPVYVSRTITQPAVVERVVEQPLVVRPAHRGLIPGIYRFIFGG